MGCNLHCKSETLSKWTRASNAHTGHFNAPGESVDKKQVSLIMRVRNDCRLSTESS